MLTKLTLNRRRDHRPRESYDDAIAFVEERRDAFLSLLAQELAGEGKRVTRSHVQRAVALVGTDADTGSSFDEDLFRLVWFKVALREHFLRSGYDAALPFATFHLYEDALQDLLKPLETNTR